MATLRLLCPLGGRATTALVRTPSLAAEPRPCRVIAGSESSLRLVSSPSDRPEGARGSLQTKPRQPPPHQSVQTRPDPAGSWMAGNRLCRGHGYRRDGDRPSRAVRYPARAVVAVKLLRREVIEDADIAMRFRREALAATVLRHRNIVACLETGTDDGQPVPGHGADRRRGPRGTAAARADGWPRRRPRRRPRPPAHRPRGRRRPGRTGPGGLASSYRWCRPGRGPRCCRRRTRSLEAQSLAADVELLTGLVDEAFARIVDLVTPYVG